MSKKEETSLNFSISAGIWFAVATSIMLSRKGLPDGYWWLELVFLFIAMFLYSVSFYALGKAVSKRIAEDARNGLWRQE